MTSDSDAVARFPLHKKLIFSIVPLLVLSGVIEMVFRLIPRTYQYHETVAGLVVPDPDLIWRLKPHERGPLKTNALGFRDDPLEPGADVRVLLLGDSVAWGEGIHETQAVFPQVAERLMGRRAGGRRIEIVNSAVLGYSTFQELRYLELRGLELKPDLVVLQFCLNDVVERYASLSSWGGGDRFLGIDTREAIPGLFGWMVRRSRAFEAMVRGAVRLSRNWQEYDVRKMTRDRLSPELEEAWRLTLSELDGIRGGAGLRRIPFLLVITPYRFQLQDPAHLDQPQRRLLEYARQHDLPVLDLLPEFAGFGREAPAIDLFIDENHFSDAGHQLAGERLAAALLAMLAVKDSGRIPG